MDNDVVATNAFEATQDLCAREQQPAAERPRLVAKVGTRIQCVDRAEGVWDLGTVTASTFSGGLKVRWDGSGEESWTHDRQPTLSLLPEWARAECERCGGHGRETVDHGEPSEREVDCADCVHAHADATTPRFDVLPCSNCHGVGSLPERHHEADGSGRRPCDDCSATAATVERVTGAYELGHGQAEPQLKGEPLPALAAMPERLLDWARALSEHLQSAPSERARAFAFTAELRDDLVLLVHAVDHHVDQLDEERTARELRDDARDDEMAALHAHVATVEADLETERQRVERLQTQLKEAREGNAVLKAALELEHKMRETDAAELSHLRVEVEASRVAVQEATQAVLDAGAELTVARVAAEIAQAGGIEVMPAEPKVVS